MFVTLFKRDSHSHRISVSKDTGNFPHAGSRSPEAPQHGRTREPTTQVVLSIRLCDLES